MKINKMCGNCIHSCNFTVDSMGVCNKIADELTAKGEELDRRIKVHMGWERTCWTPRFKYEDKQIGMFFYNDSVPCLIVEDLMEVYPMISNLDYFWDKTWDIDGVMVMAIEDAELFIYKFNKQ